jgi:ABC-type branched-subunit amino acid transport system substrate-binding protein
VEELALKEKVMAIIGPLASKPALAAAKKAQELGIPIITLTQRDGITAEGEMVFRNFLTPSKEVKTVLDKMMAQGGLNRFAILYPDNSYGRFFMNLFWDGVEQLGGVITAVESYHPDETDFAAQIKKMVGLYYPRPEPVGEELENEENLDDEQDEDEPDSEEEPEPIVDFDAVFIPDNHHKVALIAPHFPFHNVFNILFLGTSLWQSSELIETSGDYVQGAIFPSGFFEKSSSETIKEFVELYKENFESEPGALAANGYDTTRFLKRLKAERKIRTREDFLKALLAHDSFFYGVTGRISFDAQGEVEKDPILLTISGRHLFSLP